MCCIEPSNLSDELGSLKIGSDSIAWYKRELDKYSEITRELYKTERKVDSSGKEPDKAADQQTDERFLGEFANAFLLK